jgi:hypothetical protein
VPYLAFSPLALSDLSLKYKTTSRCPPQACAIGNIPERTQLLINSLFRSSEIIEILLEKNETMPIMDEIE